MILSIASSKAAAIEAAAFLPSPIAKITVAGPRTMSPPAYTPLDDDFSVSSSTSIWPPLRVIILGIDAGGLGR